MKSGFGRTECVSFRTQIPLYHSFDLDSVKDARPIGYKLYLHLSVKAKVLVGILLRSKVALSNYEICMIYFVYVKCRWKCNYFTYFELQIFTTCQMSFDYTVIKSQYLVSIILWTKLRMWSSLWQMVCILFEYHMTTWKLYIRMISVRKKIYLILCMITWNNAVDARIEQFSLNKLNLFPDAHVYFSH